MTKRCSMLLALILLLFTAVCNGPFGGRPERADPDTGAARAGPATAADGPGDADGVTPSPRALATRKVTFRVQVPANTPPGDKLHVLIMPFLDWAWTQHVPLSPAGGGVWTGAVAVDEGALLRYAYDRWDGQAWGDAFKDRREAAGGGIAVDSRLLLVTPDLEQVEDVVHSWQDRPSDAPTGAVAGTVVDAATGQPVMDANVSVAGLHLATDHDGRFHWPAVAAGPQRITVHRNRGDYRPAAGAVQVPVGGTGEVRIALEQAMPVRVTFVAQLPDDTPPEAEIRLAGNVYQAGARPGVFPNQPLLAADLHLPVLRRVAPNRAEGSLDLYAGTYLQYFYSIGSSGHGREYDAGGAPVYRSFVVNPAAATRRDTVAAWRQPGQSRLTLRLAVPPNTTPGAPVALNAGPSHWLTRTGPGQWTFFLHGFPGDTIRYRYLLGDDPQGVDASTGLADGWRTVVMPPADRVEQQQVERWAGTPAVTAPAAGAPVRVTWRVSVPPDTPPGAAVRLVGDHPALADGVALRPQPGNPWLHEATVTLDGAGSIRYRYERGAGGTAAVRTYETAVAYDGQVVHDWVTAWPGTAGGAGAARPGFVAGFYPPDFWSPGFLALSRGTFQRIRAHNGNLVALSSVWSYGQTQPLPAVESRRLRAGAVNAPREDLLAQAEIARAQGLQVLLAPQFNMEMSPGGVEAVCRSQDSRWWRAWLVEAERLWLWHARVAAEMDAAALLLPGPCFHVFGSAGDFETPQFAAEFDRQVSGLLARVRRAYGGKLLVTGSARGFAFPEAADWLGVTTYDTGHPELPADATVEQWRAAYDRLLAERVDPIHAQRGKPVLFYTVHLPPVSGDPDATGQEAQARRLEGFFQALDGRPWIVGILTWAYGMIDAPLVPGDGVRSRPAEAVLAKYYGRYAGQR